MKKNDKIIVVFGVIILILASVGIYYYQPEASKTKEASVNDFVSVTGVIKDAPTAIKVSDSSPFYALIATPLAVHYDADGQQTIAPLYVENYDEPSDAVKRCYSDQLDMYNVIKLDDSLLPKAFSLRVAKDYWTESEAALLIQYNQTGYELGVMATPIASYLSIPVIVTDTTDSEVLDVLSDLGVKKTIVCGDLEGYGVVKSFDNIDDIVDMTIDLLNEKFMAVDPDYEINYITVTNPADAFPPEVLDSEIVIAEKGSLKSGNLLPSHLLQGITGMLNPPIYTFTIPDDYKYARVKFDLKNLEPAIDIERFGDNIILGGTLTDYLRTVACPAERDGQGNLKNDRMHFESVFYNSEGQEYTISLTSVCMIQDSIDYEITVKVEQLNSPITPMMEQFSSVAPYLAAYHKGLVYGKTDFAFAPNDDVKYNGKTLPGNTQVMYNPILIPVVNQHVYEVIHKSINSLIAKIRNIDLDSIDLEELHEDCSHNPFYIALVGDAIMLPQYYYRSPHSDPFENPSIGAYATNVPSDFIYGNIDPGLYSLAPYPSDYLENDLYTDFPEVENIVGRITGWDVQDASALIARTIFYDDIIADMTEWKDNGLVMVGAGTEMQKLPILNAIRNFMGNEEPTKFPSGEKYFMMKRIEENYKQGGFNVVSLERAAAARIGFSNDALLAIKFNKIPNILLFPFWAVKIRQNLEDKDSVLSLDWWIKAIFGDGSENVQGGKSQENSNYILSDAHAIWFETSHTDVLLHELGIRPKIIYSLLSRYTPIPGIPWRTPLDNLGSYTVREVSDMKMGPSLILMEGCGSGKIDGVNPELFLGNAYLHSGVNAFISPTTFSAFYGALEPRYGKQGVGLGIAGYLKAASNAKKGIYPDVYFNEYIFEHMMLSMFDDADLDVGTALRDAKNDYLPAQFDITFRWTPPLDIMGNLPSELQNDIQGRMKTAAESQDDTFPVEKYATIFQINLLGDPAFNPYEPCNEG